MTSSGRVFGMTKMLFMLALVALVLGLAQSDLRDFTLEDIISTPANTFTGVGFFGSGALVRKNGTCLSHMIAGASQDAVQAGSAQVFERRTELFWNDVGQLTPPAGAAGDTFGSAVASSTMTNGDTLLAIGSPLFNSAEGKVEVFVFDGSDYVLSETLTTDPFLATSLPRQFGFAVAMSEKYLAVGFPHPGNTDNGMAVFQYNGTSMVLKRLAYEDLGVADLAGYSVDVAGEYAAAGRPAPLNTAGGAYLVVMTAAMNDKISISIGEGPLDSQASEGARCGHSVLMTLNPLRLMLGCPVDERILSVDINVDPMTAALLQDIDTPSSNIGISEFGASMARLPDMNGTNAFAIGSPGHNASQGLISIAMWGQVAGNPRFVLVDYTRAPLDGNIRFGEDLTAAGQYLAVGSPAPQMASTPVPSSRQACEAYELLFDGLSPGTEVLTRDVTSESSAATVTVALSTNDAANHPLVAFNSSDPNHYSLDLGTPSILYGGPGFGLGGFLGSYKNKEALGNLLVIADSAPTTDPRDHPTGGTMVFDFSEDVLVEEVTLVDAEGDFEDIAFYADGGALLGTAVVPFALSNSVINVIANVGYVRRMVVTLNAGGAVHNVKFHTGCGGTNNGTTPGDIGSGGSGASGVYYVYRYGDADAACDLGIPSDASPAASLSSLLSALF